MIGFPRISPASLLLAASMLGPLMVAGCATVPAPTISREGDLRAAPPAGTADDTPRTQTVIVDGQARTLAVA